MQLLMRMRFTKPVNFKNLLLLKFEYSNFEIRSSFKSSIRHLWLVAETVSSELENLLQSAFVGRDGNS